MASISGNSFLRKDMISLTISLGTTIPIRIRPPLGQNKGLLRTAPFPYDKRKWEESKAFIF